MSDQPDDDSDASRSSHAAGAAELGPGELIAERYKVLSFIGAGATGSVYHVEQVFMKRRFALKILNLAASPALQRRFQKEAQAAGKLDHANLARAVDFGFTADRRPFMIMDFVEGETLARRLKEAGRLTVDQAVKIFIPVCFALDYAHGQGVIHRDIKPSNIVISRGEDGCPVPRVVDFGIARLTEESESESLTKTGEVFGTPYYMSPEQCAGLKVDRRSDIYSLGCALYEALTGGPPFCANTALETMMLHRTQAVASLSEASLGFSFSLDLENVVAKMLAKDPDHRYQTCADLADDLIRLQAGDRVAAKPAVARTETKARSGRQSLFQIVSLLVAVTATITAVTLYVQQRRSELPAARTGQSQAPFQSPFQPVASTQSVLDIQAPGQAKDDRPYCIGDRTGVRKFYFSENPRDWNFTYGSNIDYLVDLPDGKARIETFAANRVVTVPPRAFVIFVPSLPFYIEHPERFRHFSSGDVQRVSLESVAILDIDSDRFNKSMTDLGAIRDLEELRFYDVPLSVEGMTNLKTEHMKKLNALWINRADITGGELARFKILHQIQKLEFTHGEDVGKLIVGLKDQWKIPPGGVMVRQRQLLLRSDNLTDSDLSAINGLDFIYLNICGNHELTDAGVRQLAKHKGTVSIVIDVDRLDRDTFKFLALEGKLKWLTLNNARWSQAEKEQFKKSVPGCFVTFGGRQQSPDQRSAPILP